MKIKYQIKKNFNLILFTISLSILLSQILYGIYNNYISNNESEKIIGKANTYTFWNLTQPNEENLDKIDNFINILPIDNDYEKNTSEEYYSIIYEIFLQVAVNTLSE